MNGGALRLGLALLTTTPLAAKVLTTARTLEATTTAAAMTTGGTAVALEAAAALSASKSGAILAAVLALPIALTSDRGSRLRHGKLGLGHGRNLGLLRELLKWLLRPLLLLLLLLLDGSRLEIRDGPRNALGVLVDVEALVNGRRDGLDLCA